ncbi:ubiquitin-like modifier 1 [Crassisporium funariophilum]|nr:ubiquitin-like modifier 1 [Crassisporium funariophilum]
MSTIPLRIEFGGGCELLFRGNKRSHRIEIPSIVPVDHPDLPIDLAARLDADHTMTVEKILAEQTKPADVSFLIHYLADNLLKGRVEMFMEKGTVRPGILVLINDVDWELEGEGEYQLQANDEIVFISTLHGG